MHFVEQFLPLFFGNQFFEGQALPHLPILARLCLANLTVESGTESPDVTVTKVIDALKTIDDERSTEAAAE